MAAGKARVHELAKELGVTSKEVLARLSEQGEFVKSASSTVEAPVARRLRESFGGSKPAPAKGTAKSPGKGPDKSLDKALDAAIDMAAGNGKATAAPAKAADSGGAAIVSPTTPAAPEPPTAVPPSPQAPNGSSAGGSANGSGGGANRSTAGGSTGPAVPPGPPGPPGSPGAASGSATATPAPSISTATTAAMFRAANRLPLVQPCFQRDIIAFPPVTFFSPVWHSGTNWSR